MHIAVDLSNEGLYTIDQTAEITGYSHSTVAAYSRKLNVTQIKGVRYFRKEDIEKMQSLYMKKDNKKGKDITGRKINFLTAIENTGEKRVVNTRYNSYVWKWQCVCGNIIEATVSEVTSKNLQSCGCMNLAQKKKQIINARNNVKWYENTNVGRLGMTAKGKLQKNNKTGVNGVEIRYMDGKKKYVARIGIKKKDVHIGYFDTLEKAVKARQLAEKKYHNPIVNEYESLSKIRKAIKDEVENG